MGETIKKNEITQELENAEVLPFGKNSNTFQSWGIENVIQREKN